MQTVVHMISGDEAEQRTALAVVRNLLNEESGAIDDVAVVVQAGGIDAVLSGADSADRVRALLDDGVPFRACSNTLAGRDLSTGDLVEGVETVPEGAVEVTRLQDEGYAYVRP